MSGRGRSGRGGRGNYHGGRSGRGSGRSGGRGNNNNNNRSGGTGKDEMKFVPQYSGKQQIVTYDTVKDHVILQIQKNYKHGSDIAKAIRDESYAGIGSKPVRQTVLIPTGTINQKIK